MQFQLTDTYRYWWPVTVRMPDPEKPGKIIEQKLKIQFLALNRDEALAASAKASKLTDPAEIAADEKEQLLAICTNWDDVVGDDKAPIAWSKDVFSKAIQQGWFRTAVYVAYGQSMDGKEAQTGN